ncbi:MAG: bifunctional chorismate mutase/prephenate dehydrogenase [Xanthomonadales bacterium]|nr:bifunctional chorismate mutase/prephenate dehydrogenase [Gammaproteobacteria bacterium]MBT8052297.1 bifunctional chorismate mutase/prephenate dehydrogenase [Gammaproteobacteria bacterium]NND56910.1 bifunctional chorismate mutase/prephenate dehydrogenase [Xanthomonadales bacterium]NNK51521.1 bifunctional chorismate mutase/prephenate dehydrogenase [Xanthomonadales bacterium]
MPVKPPLTADELLELRDRLDDIDSGIVDLIAERQAVVTAIGDHKLRTGAPLRHYAREREVIDRGMARAESLGLPGAVARDVLETLIHHSLGNQETYKLVQSDHGAGRRALVIGGLGRMGEWMSRYLDMVGYHVAVADPVVKVTPFERAEEWEQHADDYDLIVVAVPLRPSNDILLRLAELKPRGLIFDIGSLKSPMRTGLEALTEAGCRVCSVHPMFGPNEIGLSGRHILFVDTGNREALSEARALFAHTAAECVDLSLEEHDEVMAWVLGLSHLVNIAFASALAESGEAVPLLRQISSSTFNAQLKVAAQVVSENPRLYYEIQQGNHMTGDVAARFRRVFDELTRSVREQDEDSWIRAMEIANSRISSGSPD